MLAAAEPAEPVVAPTNEIVCDITFWRGYRKCAFFARADLDGEEVAIAESPLFRARGNGIPEHTEDAVAAYEALVSQLERQGWHLAEEGSQWFDQTFRMAEQTANEAGPD